MIALLASLALASVAPPAAPPAEAEIDARADAKRDEMIRDLTAVIPRLPANARRADVEFQLAEVWWEKARYASLLEGRRYDEAYTAWQKTKQGEEPRVDPGRSEEYRRKALGLYRSILDRYPDYPRRDEVLFVYGHNLYESGARKEAVESYLTLVQRHPESRFAPDAWVQMGEHYFSANDLARARAAYEKAASYRLPKLYPFALYKLAWCDYNAGAFTEAIAKFKQVIAYAEGETSKDRVQLRSEALRDIALAYMRIDEIDGAVQYFAAKAGAGAVEAIERLANTYFEAGKFEQAIRVYRMLEARDPANMRAPAWQQRILVCWDKLDRRDQVAQETKKLIRQYGPRSGWAKLNAQQQGALSAAHDTTETALRELVQDYHQEAARTKSVATYRLARDIYAQYLEAFGGTSYAPRMRFYYAEILYALEEWDAAAEQYGAVADADPKGEYAVRAAYDAVLALEKSVDIAAGKLRKRELADGAKIDEGRDKGHVAGRSALPARVATAGAGELAVPANEQALIAACDRYARIAPGGKDEILIRYKAAFLYYQRRHFVEAAGRFGEIILRWPTDAWSQRAATLSLDILERREQWLALAEMAERFLADRNLCPPGSKLAADFAVAAEGARFKHVMQIFEVQKDFPAAAREFRAFVTRVPRSPHAAKALYNALVIADRADELDVEIAAGEQLLRDYPRADAAILKLAIPALGSACERAGRYRCAIRWYEEAQRRWPDDDSAPDWLYDAAVWREGMGDDAGALQAWQKYLRLYRSRPDAPRIAFNVGLLLERGNALRRAATHWEEFQRDWSRAASAEQLLLARYRQGLMLHELHAAEAPKILSDVVARFRRLPAKVKSSPPVIEAAAHARFLTVEQEFKDFSTIRFASARQGALVSTLKAKNAKLAALVAAYGSVIAIGSPIWSEAAFARLGAAYRDFNKGLLEAPIPRGLDAEQQELYRSTLAAQASPLEDKATEALRKAIEISAKSGVYSKWVIEAQELLQKFQPDAFGEMRKPRFSGAPVAPIAVPDLGGGGT